MSSVAYSDLDVGDKWSEGIVLCRCNRISSCVVFNVFITVWKNNKVYYTTSDLFWPLLVAFSLFVAQFLLDEHHSQS